MNAPSNMAEEAADFFRSLYNRDGYIRHARFCSAASLRTARPPAAARYLRFSFHDPQLVLWATLFRTYGALAWLCL